MRNGIELNRRDFLKTAAAAAVGCGLGRCVFGGAPEDGSLPPREALATVTPGRVGVSPEALQEAVDFVSKEVDGKTFPGAALVATRGGRKFLEKFWGTCAGPERAGMPYDGSVQNMMYSFSKAVTATVVVMAHQDGLIDYDAPVCRYIPEFVGGGKEQVTVRHVLTHAAGLTKAPSDPVSTEEQWKTAIARLCAMEVEWEPGTRTGYHAVSGMLIAADIVRRVSGGKPWNDICQERLFQPLGAGFTFGVPRADAPVAITPVPKASPCPVDAAHFSFLGHPSGGAFARTDDMLRLLNLHLNGGKWNGKTLIQPDALAEMHRVQYQPQIDAALAAGDSPKHENWGLGWLLRGNTNEGWFGFGNVASQQTFGHAGIDTVIGLADPANDVAVVFLTTGSPSEAAITTRVRNTVTNRVMAAIT
jgi:CubicO group peptidase (beta-lactamase class C family)